MSEFICKKPITLSGHSFSYGEVIPDGFVLPGRALALIRSNYIAEIDGGVLQAEVAPILPFQSENEETLITIPISTEKGILEVITSSKTITTVFSIMQKKVEDAERDIAELEDEDTLILLNAADSRKGIQKAAEERSMILKRAGESPDEDQGGDAVGTEEQEKDGA